MTDQEHDEQLAEVRRLARLIREEPQWALARVMRAAELEARLTELSSKD